MKQNKVVALLAFTLVCGAVVSSTAQERQKLKRGKKIGPVNVKVTGMVQVGDAKPVRRTTTATIIAYEHVGGECSQEGETATEERKGVTEPCTVDGQKYVCTCDYKFELECRDGQYSSRSYAKTCSFTKVVKIPVGSPLEKLFK